VSVVRGVLDDFVGVGGEDGALGAGEVILWELGDLLEEPGAGLVVEEPRSECSRMCGKASASFGGYCVRSA
jgi:hypothetical protein